MYPEERSRRKFLYQKVFLFLKIRGFWEKNFRIFVKLFPARLTSFHPTFAEQGFRGKFSRKKFFFHCLQTWSKKSTIEGTAGCLWKLYSTCLVEFSEDKHSFRSYMIYFFMYFERRIVKFEKKFRIIVEVAFYTSGGTSRCNCFGSLKTYFP